MMDYKTCKILLLLSSCPNLKYTFDLGYLTSEKENLFFKNSHRQRHFRGNVNGLNTLLQGGRAAPLFQTCTSTRRKVCMHKGFHARGLCLGYREMQTVCAPESSHIQCSMGTKEKFNCKSEHILPCFLEERPKQLSLLFFLSSIKSASVSPGEAHVIPAVTREVAAVATQKTKTCPYTQHRQGQAEQTDITGSTTVTAKPLTSHGSSHSELNSQCFEGNGGFIIGFRIISYWFIIKISNTYTKGMFTILVIKRYCYSTALNTCPLSTTETQKCIGFINK